MLETFDPQPGTQIVIVKNTPYTLVQDETNPGQWQIIRGGTILGWLHREEPVGWGVWPFEEGCTLIQKAGSPGQALLEAL